MKPTDSDDCPALERRIREAYGREILGFLIARLRDRDAASDVFSMFTENVWKGLAGFRWDCTARVWCYALARHAASRYIEDARRRRGRHVLWWLDTRFARCFCRSAGGIGAVEPTASGGQIRG